MTARTPTVTLISWTTFPIETIYCIWQASRIRDWCMTAEEVAERRKVDSDFDREVCQIWDHIIDSQIPILKNLNFIFLVENISISWREQAVRHQIGTQIGPSLGVDIIPDHQDATYWSQTMRVMDMGVFASENRYRVPDTLEGVVVGSKTGNARDGEDLTARAVFDKTMSFIERSYNELVAAGVPREDAREIIPLGAQHAMTWGLNLAAMIHIMSKRSCWIAQLGTWGTILTQMVNELANKIHPSLRKIVTPPCIKNEQFKGCPYLIENDRRMDARDYLPPCSLYLNNHSRHAAACIKTAKIVEGVEIPPARTEHEEACRIDLNESLELHGDQEIAEQQFRNAFSFIDWNKYYEMMESYYRLWGRDPRTGRLLSTDNKPNMTTPHITSVHEERAGD